MARRQRQFCTRSSPLICCSESSSQASTSGRELSFSFVGHDATERRGRPLVFASTALKAQVSTDTVAPKAAPAGGDKPIHDVIAGALARAISQGTIHPIDTLKVRMQAANKAVPSGASAAASGAAAATAAAHHAGPQRPLEPLARVTAAVRTALTDAKSLYRGVLGAASGAGIIIGAFFAFYSTSKKLLRERTDLSDGTVAFIAGAVAAVGSSVVKVPIAVCIRSVQAGVYPNALVAASSVVEKAGVRGLFTGFLPTLLEDVPDMAVKFAVYETLRAVHMQLHHQERPSTIADLLMGGVAGSAAAAATTPLDVVKTRMMCSASERPTVMQAARGILAERAGLSSFFRGVGPRALSNGLNSAIFYMWFELLRAKIRELLEARQQRRQQQQQQQLHPHQPSLLASGQAIPALLAAESVGKEPQGQQQQQLGQEQPHAAAPRSGSGHQAVASCSQRWLRTPGREDRTGSDSTSSSVTQDAGGQTRDLHQSTAVHVTENGGHGASVALQSATTVSSDRLACFSLAIPLHYAASGGSGRRSC